MPHARVVHPDAARFCHLRLQRGWNPQRVAHESNMIATYLGLPKRGLSLPSPSAVVTRAEVLGVDAGELLRHVAAGRKRSLPAVLPPLPHN